MILRVLWIVLGSISLGLGIVGVVVPGLPTTPFLLLTAVLYLNGSPKLHKWLINHRVFGKYLKNWKKGISPLSVGVTLVVMWAMVFFSVFMVLENAIVQRAVVGAAIIGTCVQFYLLYKFYFKRP